MATAEEIAQLEADTGLKVNDIINDPSSYGLNVQMGVFLEGLIADDTSDINTISLIVNQAVTSLSNLSNNTTPVPFPFGTNDERYLTIKDEQGNPLVVDGQIKTVKVDKTNIFPATNFFDAFMSSLTLTQTKAIQDAAIDAGYITENDLADELNGVKGEVTRAFIGEVLNYALETMDSYAPGGYERNNLQDKINQGFANGSKNADINSLFGGVNFATTQDSAELIESKEVFSVALEEYLNLKEQEQTRIDIATAKQIEASVRQPTFTQLEDDLFSLYKQIYNKDMSDKRMSDFATNIAMNWSPYVKALVAQDKAVKAGEVYDTFYGTSALEQMGAEPGQMVGGYVTFQKLKPEFEVENPLEAAKRELLEEAEADVEFRQTNINKEQMQKDYLAWRLGS